MAMFISIGTAADWFAISIFQQSSSARRTKQRVTAMSGFGSLADISQCNRNVRFTPERWGNRPAMLWVAEDFGCWLLTHRKLLQSKAIAIENDLRGTLRNFGLKVGMGGTVKFEARIKELVENLPDLAALVDPLLVVRRVLRQQLGILHRRLLAVVRDDEVCRRLMTVPGVGPVVALTYR